MKRRWSDPVAPARRPLGNVDSNRRQSEPPPPPPPPLASAAAVKASERKQTQHFTYDSMPKHHSYRRKRGDSGSSSGEPAAAAASTMGHAYVDAAVVSSGVASLSQSKCEHCGSRRGWAVAGETKRAIGGGSFDFACVQCGCLRHLPLSSRHGKQDEATVRFISATTTEGMGNSQVNRLLTKLDIGAVNNRVYVRVVEAVDEAAGAEVDQMCKGALQREIAATLLMEGEACRSKTVKMIITVISDGTWQKRYGRNSLAGFVGVYGLYTGECLYAGSKMARCAACS